MGELVSKLLFQPPGRPSKLSRSAGKDTEIQYVWIKTARKSYIPSLYISKKHARYTILYSHGNAEDLGMIVDFLLDLSKLLHVNIMAYDYTGYGWSNDSDVIHSKMMNIIDPLEYNSSNLFPGLESRDPEDTNCINNHCKDVFDATCNAEAGIENDRFRHSEENCYSDITAAFLYLTNVLKTSPRHIVLYGRSIGSGPTCYLANILHKKNKDRAVSVPLGGMILHSPFTSVFRIMLDFVPNTLPHDQFPNIDRISEIPPTCRVFIMHGTEDGIVPFAHGKALYDALPSSCKSRPFWAQGMGHNNIEMDAPKLYVRRLMEFFQQIRMHEQMPAEKGQVLSSSGKRVDDTNFSPPFFIPLHTNVKFDGMAKSKLGNSEILNADLVLQHSQCMMNDDYMVQLLYRNNMKLIYPAQSLPDKNEFDFAEKMKGKIHDGKRSQSLPARSVRLRQISGCKERMIKSNTGPNGPKKACGNEYIQ